MTNFDYFWLFLTIFDSFDSLTVCEAEVFDQFDSLTVLTILTVLTVWLFDCLGCRSTWPVWQFDSFDSLTACDAEVLDQFDSFDSLTVWLFGMPKYLSFSWHLWFFLNTVYLLARMLSSFDIAYKTSEWFIYDLDDIAIYRWVLCKFFLWFIR